MVGCFLVLWISRSLTYPQSNSVLMSYMTLLSFGKCCESLLANKDENESAVVGGGGDDEVDENGIVICCLEPSITGPLKS